MRPSRRGRGKKLPSSGRPISAGHDLSPGPAPAVSPNELLEIIKSRQQSEVRPSIGRFEGQNSSDEMLKKFLADAAGFV